MRFFLDTNVVVYSMHQEAPNHEEVNTFLTQCLKTETVCYFLSASLKDAYYILCRHYLTEANARQCIKMFRETFDMVDLTSSIIDGAFQSNEPDFEDALVRTSSELLQADAIVSYDKEAFANSFVPKFTAKQALDMLR